MSTGSFRAPLRDRTAPGLAALGAALILYGWLAWSFRGYTPDDSFIFFRYAENAAGGRGLVFNPGERVQGYTSALWTLILTAAAYAGLPLLAFAKIAGATLGAGCFVIAYGIARRVDARAALAAPLLLAGFIDLPYWSVAAMDAPLFAFLVALALWLTLRASERETGAGLAGFAWGLSALARPEGAALGVIALIWLSRNGQAATRRRIAAFIAFAVPVVAWAVFAFIYYGDPLPNTFWAKRFDRVESFRRGLVFLRAFVSVNDGAFIAAALGAAFWLSRARALSLIAWILVSYLAFLLWTGGDSWVSPGAFRFVVPMLVPLSVAMAIGLAAALDAIGSAARMRGAAAASAAAIALWLAFPSTAGLTTRRVGGDAAIEAYLRANGPAGSTLAVTDIGNFAYRTDVSVIDTFGLVDRWVARSLRKRTNAEYASGEAERLVDYLMERAPRWIILKGTARHGAITIQNENAAPVIYADPRFQRDYRLVVAGTDDPYLLFERVTR